MTICNRFLNIYPLPKKDTVGPEMPRQVAPLAAAGVLRSPDDCHKPTFHRNSWVEGMANPLLLLWVSPTFLAAGKSGHPS